MSLEREAHYFSWTSFVTSFAIFSCSGLWKKMADRYSVTSAPTGQVSRDTYAIRGPALASSASSGRAFGRRTRRALRIRRLLSGTADGLPRRGWSCRCTPACTLFVSHRQQYHRLTRVVHIPTRVTDLGLEAGERAVVLIEHMLRSPLLSATTEQVTLTKHPFAKVATSTMMSAFGERVQLTAIAELRGLCALDSSRDGRRGRGLVLHGYSGCTGEEGSEDVHCREWSQAVDDA